MIDIALPDDAQLSLEGLAVMVSPRGDVITPEAALPWRGVAIGGVLPANTAPTENLVFAPPSTGTNVDDTQQYASFYVDLRKFRGLPLASVDLYGAVGVVPETIPTPVRLYTVGAGSDGPFTMGSEPHPVRAYASPWPPVSTNSLSVWTGTGADLFWAPFPEIHYNVAGHYWDFAELSYETVAYAAGSLAVFTEDRYTVDTNFYPWVVYGVQSNPNDYVPAGPQSATVAVTARAFKGKPAVLPFRVHTADNLTYRWRYALNSELLLAHVGDRVVNADVGGTLQEHLGFTYLGRLNIDLHTGGVSLSHP